MSIFIFCLFLINFGVILNVSSFPLCLQLKQGKMSSQTHKQEVRNHPKETQGSSLPSLPGATTPAGETLKYADKKI